MIDDIRSLSHLVVIRLNAEMIELHHRRNKDPINTGPSVVKKWLGRPVELRHVLRGGSIVVLFFIAMKNWKVTYHVADKKRPIEASL